MSPDNYDLILCPSECGCASVWFMMVSVWLFYIFPVLLLVLLKLYVTPLQHKSTLNSQFGLRWRTGLLKRASSSDIFEFNSH